MADYQQELVKKLASAKKRVAQGVELRALRQSAPSLFEIIDVEIKNILAKMTSETPLSYDEYLSAHGQARGISKIRNVIEARENDTQQAGEEARAIEEQLKQFEDDKKQK